MASLETLLRRAELAKATLQGERHNHCVTMHSSEDADEKIREYCEARGIDPDDPSHRFLVLVWQDAGGLFELPEEQPPSPDVDDPAPAPEPALASLSTMSPPQEQPDSPRHRGWDDNNVWGRRIDHGGYKRDKR